MSDVRNRAAVLGKPIAHSLSPVLHNAAYRAMGLQDWDYGRFEFDEHGLGEFVDSRDATWRGLSLTMPLKKKALDFGRPADDFSKILNVANTLVFKKPGSHEYEDIAVYNTDVCGIQGALHDQEWQGHGLIPMGEGEPPASDDVPYLILGSGSTAASALVAFDDMGARHVTVAARNPDHAEDLRGIAEQVGVDLAVIPLTEAARHFAASRFVVSTIPAHGADGVARELANLPHSARALTGTTVLDVVYDPRPSALLLAVTATGGQAVGGHLMLLWQAVLQVGYMTGTDPQEVPVSAMRSALTAVLNGSHEEEAR